MACLDRSVGIHSPKPVAFNFLPATISLAWSSPAACIAARSCSTALIVHPPRRSFARQGRCGVNPQTKGANHFLSHGFEEGSHLFCPVLQDCKDCHGGCQKLAEHHSSAKIPA